jgi:hypothetical protein
LPATPEAKPIKANCLLFTISDPINFYDISDKHARDGTIIILGKLKPVVPCKMRGKHNFATEKQSYFSDKFCQEYPTLGVHVEKAMLLLHSLPFESTKARVSCALMNNYYFMWVFTADTINTPNHFLLLIGHKDFYNRPKSVELSQSSYLNVIQALIDNINVK